jgi:nitric oxide dioxygenase
LALLKESFTHLAVDAEGATLALFERLFQLDPRLRFLFPEDLSDQKHRLMSMIGFVVRRLHRWEQIEPRLRNLGLRHVSYGAKASDYRTFERAMLDVLASRLNLSEDSETLRAWSLLFAAVSEAMLEAAEGYSPAAFAPDPA